MDWSQGTQTFLHMDDGYLTWIALTLLLIDPLVYGVTMKFHTFIEKYFTDRNNNISGLWSETADVNLFFYILVSLL